MTARYSCALVLKVLTCKLQLPIRGGRTRQKGLSWTSRRGVIARYKLQHVNRAAINRKDVPWNTASPDGQMGRWAVNTTAEELLPSLAATSRRHALQRKELQTSAILTRDTTACRRYNLPCSMYSCKRKQQTMPSWLDAQHRNRP